MRVGSREPAPENQSVSDRPRPIRRQSLASQTESILRERLSSGSWLPGEQLPPEHELANDFGISRSTLRTAVGRLARRGVVVQRPGVGTFVAAGSALTNDLAEVEDFNKLLAATGGHVDVDFDSVWVGPVDPGLAAPLGLDSGALVFTAAKRWSVDNRPAIYAINSIPVEILGSDLATQAVADPALTEPLYDFLEDRAGVAISSVLASIEVDLASQISYPNVALDPTSPVMRFEEVAYTDGNQPIWHSTNWFAPGAMRFEVIRHRSRRVQPT